MAARQMSLLVESAGERSEHWLTTEVLAFDAATLLAVQVGVATCTLAGILPCYLPEPWP